MNPDPARRPQRSVQRKVFDVMRPGRAPASSTSKPVIVGHKPQIKDPSVTVNGVGESRQLMDSRQKIAIKPIAPVQSSTAAPVPATPQVMPAPHAAPQIPVTVASASSAESMVSKPPVASQSSAIPPSPAITATPAPPVIAPTPDLPVTSSTPAASAVTVPSASSQPHMTADDLPTDMPGMDIQEQHVTSSPHVPTEGSSLWKFLVPIIIVIVFALIIVNILLDAGFIDLPVPHTRFL
jgi:hypothetical protein